MLEGNGVLYKLLCVGMTDKGSLRPTNGPVWTQAHKTLQSQAIGWRLRRRFVGYPYPWIIRGEIRATLSLSETKRFCAVPAPLLIVLNYYSYQTIQLGGILGGRSSRLIQS